MNKRTIEQELINLFNGVINEDQDTVDQFQLDGLNRARSYSDIGLLTNDNGIILSFDSGEQFQLIIKRSK